MTGATGALGGRVARILASSGIAQRLLARSPERAPHLDDAVVVPFGGYADRDSAVAALTGVQTLFMVSASESADRLDEHRAFVDAAVEAGVQHVVYTSFYGASPDCLFTLGRDHHATEEHLRASGLHWTFLRDSFYLDFLADLADEDGVIRGPAGTGRVAAVARDDVAAAAAAVLADPRAHVSSVYDLTGPESLSMEEIAAIVATHQGRPRHLPRRDRRGGLRVTTPLGGARLAVRRVGEHLHRHRRRRARRGQRPRPHPHRTRAAEPGGAPPPPLTGRRCARVSRRCGRRRRPSG